MIADVISQLEQRDGLLPLSIEDRPRLAELLAAHPELMGAIREAHVLASRTMASAESVRLRVVSYTDTPEDGPHLVVEVWTGPGGSSSFLGLLDRWASRPPDLALPLVFVERTRAC